MWKKERFKYVKFSKGTAKDNPEMIVREYERIIRELNDKVHPLNVRKHNITITLAKSRVGNNHPTMPYWEYKSEVPLSSLEIIECYNKIIETEKAELHLLDCLKKVENELEKFKLKYKK